MIWGAISYRESINFVRCHRSINSEYYCEIQQNALLQKAEQLYSDGYRFMQDNASAHRSNYTKNWLDGHNIDVLPWPAKSPDLNPIENVWSHVARRVYLNKRPYPNLTALEIEVKRHFGLLELDYLKKLYESMPKRLISVVEKSGNIVDY